MKYEFYVALRYLRAKKKDSFLSIITVISILGIIVGVASLILAMALTSGLHSDIQEKLLGTNSHIYVFQGTSQPIKDYGRVMAVIGKLPEVEACAPVIFSNLMVVGTLSSRGTVVKGVVPEMEKQVTTVFSNIIQGSAEDLTAGGLSDEGVRNRPGILLGKELALDLGVVTGDLIKVISVESGLLSPLGILPKIKYFRVAGIFEMGLYEFDATYSFIALEEAQKLGNLEEAVEIVEVKISDIHRAGAVAEKIRERLGRSYAIKDWMELNKPLYSAFKIEKLLLFVTLSLIIIVAAMNIISALVMMVMDKEKSIGILVSMGAAQRHVMLIFMIQGLIIGLIGTTIGAALGILVAWILDNYHLIKVSTEVYQISYIPFKVRAWDVTMITLTALLISFLATIYPARKAAKCNPSEALRTE
jgi:lipoprotein-releasing system permease protein